MFLLLPLFAFLVQRWFVYPELQIPAAEQADCCHFSSSDVCTSGEVTACTWRRSEPSPFGPSTSWEASADCCWLPMLACSAERSHCSRMSACWCFGLVLHNSSFRTDSSEESRWFSAAGWKKAAWAAAATWVRQHGLKPACVLSAGLGVAPRASWFKKKKEKSYHPLCPGAVLTLAGCFGRQQRHTSSLAGTSSSLGSQAADLIWASHLGRETASRSTLSHTFSFDLRSLNWKNGGGIKGMMWEEKCFIFL